MWPPSAVPITERNLCSIPSLMYSFSFDHGEFYGEDNGHDDVVERHHFTGYDRDQILHLYSRCFDTTAED